MQTQQKAVIRVGEQAWQLLHSEQRMGESYEKALIRSLTDLKSLRDTYQPVHVAKVETRVEKYQALNTTLNTTTSVDPEPEPLIVEDEEDEDDSIEDEPE